ncbi:RidA family protein [Thermodesulfobacteriota bacterium]
MATTLINPPDLAEPKGFSHGAIGTGRVLFIAGQTGIDKEENVISDDLVAQFDQAMGNLVCVLTAAGGKPEDIVKITLLVLDKNEYRENARDIGKAYRKHLGRHFPAMTLAEVKGLYEDEYKVEIEAVAILP